MKGKISITIEESTISEIEALVETGRFRNKSHAIEYAVTKHLESLK